MKLKSWFWLGYPLMLVLVIIISGSMLFGSTGLWDRITINQKQLSDQSEQAEKLRTKLSKLQQADLATETDNLAYLLNALPAQKDLPTLLAQIQQAASSSGVVFDGFKANVGEVAASESATPTLDKVEIKVSLSVANLDQLAQMIDMLEHSMPLVSVNDVEMDEERVTMVVEGRWSLLPRLQAGADFAVNDLSTNLALLRSKLASFSELSVNETVVDDSQVSPNPFQ